MSSRPRRIEPGPGQESVWDYPRPPRVEASSRHVVVTVAGHTVADTRRALRVLETSQPPAYYIPPQDVRLECLRPTGHTTWCEFKGTARHHAITVGGHTVADAAWSYPDPTPGFEAIRDHLAFYPARVEACFVDGERVSAQEGDFYGGWITHDVVGPFKGGPGTAGW